MIAIRKPRRITHKPLEAYFIKPGKRSQEKKKAKPKGSAWPPAFEQATYLRCPLFKLAVNQKCPFHLFSLLKTT